MQTAPHSLSHLVGGHTGWIGVNRVVRGANFARTNAAATSWNHGANSPWRACSPWPLRKEIDMRQGATFAVLLAVSSCAPRELGHVEPKVQQGIDIRIVQAGEVAVDLLVVVDDSSSMEDEQTNLGDNFQHLVRSLTSPEDADGDGEPDHAPVTDLHVGIVSTNMGVRGATGIQTCGSGPYDRDALDGDDGIFIDVPRDDEALGCAEQYEPFLSYDPESTRDDVYKTPEELDHAFQCLANLGTNGCGFEQQLDATTRALIDHAGGANAGFLREDSLLAIVMLTDEEDCSVRRDDPNAIDLYTDPALGAIQLRCHRHGDQFLEPVETFVNRLIALRADEPHKLVFAGITGIPLSTRCSLTDMDDADFACVLDDPYMQQVEQNDRDGLAPACLADERGDADPARRIVEVIQGIDARGGNGIVRSICEADFRPAMEAISRLIQKQFDGACLARPLQRDGDGQVVCRVIETLDGAEACPRGRVDLGLERGRRVCQVCQEGDGSLGNRVDALGTDLSPCAADVAAGHYWHYVEDAPDCAAGRVVFEGDSVALEGSEVDLECLSTVDGTDDGVVGGR
jgi:hypothetical protein